MLADPLTKSISFDRLVESMITGRFDMRPTADSLMTMEKNHACHKELTLLELTPHWQVE